MPSDGMSQQNPRFLLSDTSSLLQLALGEMLGVLKALKSCYGVQALLVERVEVELRSLCSRRPKFIGTAASEVEKAFDGEVFKILDDGFAQQENLSSNFMDDLDNQARSLMLLGADDGESYMHAAAKALDMPVLTNDEAAIRVLEHKGAIEPKFLRSFDIAAFAAQINHASHGECDAFRSSLQKSGETIEKVFRGRSFSQGLDFFFLRIVDCDLPVIGSSSPIDPYDNYRLKIKRL